MRCARCDGRGYKKLPKGTYGMIPCTKCYSSGVDPSYALRQACKRASDNLNKVLKDET